MMAPSAMTKNSDAIWLVPPPRNVSVMAVVKSSPFVSATMAAQPIATHRTDQPR